MFVLLILLLSIGYFSFFLRANYLGELLISFLPYLGGLMLIGLLLSLWQLAQLLYKPQKEKKNGLFHQLSVFFVIGFSVILGLFLQETKDFYGKFSLENNQDPVLKVLFSNIYKDNPSYQDISEQIKKENPDLVMFVEFDPHHYQHLKTFFEQEFAYIDYLPQSTSIIASKYPFEQLPTSVQKQKWQYYHIKLQKDHETFYGYLIHTSSPTSKRHFLNRNIQLNIIANDFIKLHKAFRESGSKIFMVGDFNVTPWSVYYKIFAESIANTMQNATRKFPHYFSWNLAKLLKISGIVKNFPQLFYAHIDQLFVSQSTRVKSLNGIQFSGSDHKGFIFELN